MSLKYEHEVQKSKEILSHLADMSVKMFTFV